MLRLNTLAAAVCLAVLASCTSSEPEGTASKASLRRTSTALVTDTFTVKWTGSRSPTETCLNCRTDGTAPGDFQCVTNTTTSTVYLERPLPNMVPAGAVVVGILATVHGRLVDTTDSDKKEQLFVQLNDLDIGLSNEVAEADCATNGACSTGWSREYPSSPSTTAIPGFGASNTLKVGVSGPDSTGPGKASKYCLSHVDVRLTYLPRTLVVESPASGSLGFGNQKNGTTSGPMLVRVKNTGEAPVKVITPSIHDEAGGTFTLSSPYAPATTFDLAAGATSEPFSVTFNPAAGGGAASGILSFTSNETGFPAGSNPTVDIPLSGTGVPSAVEVSPTSLSLTFDPVRVNGTSTAKTVTVRNVGNVPTTPASFNITGVSIGAGQPFDVSPKTGFAPVVAGTSGTPLSVTFKPTAAGANQTGTLTIQTDDPDRPTIAVSLSGTGEKSTALLSKTELTFAPLRVGNTSVGQSLTVSNPGSARLNVSSVSITGPFEVSSTAGFSVDPSGTPVPFTVTFKPVAEGEDQPGVLTFHTDDPDNLTATVSLSGTGIKPTIALSPNPLTFEPQRVDSVSAPKTVTVSNDGSEILNVSSVAVSGPFEVSSTAGFSVTAGSSKSLTVKCMPTVEGPDQPGTLTFTTNEPGRTTATLALSGTGIKPTIGLNPSPLTFAPQRVDTVSAPRTVTVSNSGSEPLIVSAVAISGPFEVSSTEGFVVNNGTPKTLTVTFRPTAEGADQPGLLTFTTNEPRKTTATLALSGTGVMPHLVVTPTTTPLNFNEQRVDTTSAPQTVTVSNVTGSGPIRITSVSIGAGEPFTVSSTDAFTLESGQSRPLSVTFHPTTENPVSGTLTFTTDYTPLSTVTVSLSGKGIKPTVELSTTELNFGTQGVGSPSTPKPVTVRNIGSGTLRITSISVSSPSYQIDSTAPFELTETSREKTLSVTFLPLAQGSISGTITLRTNDPEHDPVTISLSGNGQTELNVPPTTIDFTSVRVGTTGEQEVTFTNNGPVSIRVESASSVSNRFTLEGLPVDVGPGMPSVPLKVKFSPLVTGVSSDRITVTSSATNSPHTLNVTGMGTESKVRVSLREQPNQQLTALDFGNVEVSDTAQKMVRLTNVGSATLDLERAVVVSKLADGGTVPFEYLGQPSLLDIAADGGYVDFPVTFKPTENATSSATLVLTTNAVNSPVELPLLGTGVSAQLSLSPSSLVFASQHAGIKSPPQTVYITNDGKADLKIEGFTFTNTDFAISSPSPLPSPEAPLVVAKGGGKVAISVIFTPTVRAPVTGSITVQSNAVGSASTLSLSGTGVDGLSDVQPTAVDFGKVEVGFSSDPVALRVKNMGDAPLILKSATIQNPSEVNPFIISGFTSGATLRASSTDVHEFFVTFKPLVNGYQSATLVLETDSWLNPKHNVTVAGTGEGAQVELFPESLVFAKTNVGESDEQTLNIRNSGVRTLKIYGISFREKTSTDGGTDGGTAGPLGMASEFSVGRSADGGSLFTLSVDAGDSVSVPIGFKFSPTMVGFREATGVIASNAKTVEFNASGQATSPILTVEPENRKLEIEGVLLGKSSTGQIKITNTGNGPISIETVTLSQAGTSFSLAPIATPIVLAPNAMAPLFVTFSPTEEQPYASAQLIAVPSSSYVPQVLVEIIGVGVRDPVSVESELDFGQQLVGNTSLPRTLHVSNNTDSSITLTGASVGTNCTQFKFVTLPTSVPLVRGTPFPLDVTFSPRTEGDVNCVLKLFFAQLPEMQIPLHGKGIPSVLSVSPSPLDFGTLRAATGMKEAPITFLNLSSDPITFAAPEVRYTNGEPFIFDWASLEGLELRPGEAIIRKVKYQPAVESFSDTTVFFGTTTPTTPVGVELKMTGKAAKRILNADVTSLDFGRLDANKPAQTKTIIITNKSPQPQRVEVALKPLEGSPFAVKTSGLEEAIAPEGTVTISVTFDSDKAGEAEDEVQVRLQGITEPELQIPVKGIGRVLTGIGGGCACGSTEAGSAGMLMLLALVGLGSRRRRRE